MTAEISGIEDLQLLTEGCDEVAVHTANALTCLCLALQAAGDSAVVSHLLDAIGQTKRVQFRMAEAKDG